MPLRPLRAALGAAFVVALGCQALKPPPEPVKPVQRSDVANVTAGDRRFAFRLYRALRERPGSFAFSPAGARMALAMAWAGAEGDTAVEIGEVAGLGGDPTAIHQANQALLGVWQKAEGGGSASFKVRIGQGFFAQTERQPAQPFVELLQRHYRAPFSPKDFSSPETVRSQINTWVEKRTDGRMPELLPEGSLDVGLELLLVSAVDFEATWKRTFDPALTRKGKFEPAAGKKLDAMLMTQSAELPLSETAGALLVELEYEGDGFVFDLILPKGDLASFEKSFDEQELDRMLSALLPKELTLTLPRFRAGDSVDLAPDLQRVGIHMAFEKGKADFSSMTGTRQVFVSKVPHKVGLRVDEGATAESAGDAGTGKLPPVRGVDVRAVRPFLWLVRDKKRSAILAFGRVVEPREG